MDVSDSVAVVYNSRRRAGGRRPEVGDSRPRNADWRDASPFRATARSEIVKSFVRECVQAPCRNVVFNLAIPHVSVEFREPFPEFDELGRGEPQYRFLDFFYTAHDLQLTRHCCACTTAVVSDGHNPREASLISPIQENRKQKTDDVHRRQRINDREESTY